MSAETEFNSTVHIPQAPSSDWRRLTLIGVVLALMFYAYGVSKTCVVGITPTSALGWLFTYWGRGGEYAHGYVVPIIAAGLFVWLWRRQLAGEALNSAASGLAVIVVAAVVYWVGVRGANPRLVASSLVVLIFGLILYAGGWRWARVLWFPCAFLVFMIPLNFLEPYVSFPLRIFVAHISTGVLQLMGLDVYQNGTGILSRAGRFAPLDVADPCSGIRSLVALMALTSLYGYVTMDRGWKKWVLFGSSIPLAVLGNVARITTVALVAQGFGSDWAMKIYHDYSGYIVFSLAILSMVVLGVMLNLQYRDILHRWIHEEVPGPVLRRREKPRYP
ncbi:MAG: exosortase/archaeosortase family protein [Verrucomicrobia bacterium]|nr:exosortase/archaeosortase family protein [Verrucomicrobiota bacterium]